VLFKAETLRRGQYKNYANTGELFTKYLRTTCNPANGNFLPTCNPKGNFLPNRAVPPPTGGHSTGRNQQLHIAMAQKMDALASPKETSITIIRMSTTRDSILRGIRRGHVTNYEQSYTGHEANYEQSIGGHADILRTIPVRHRPTNPEVVQYRQPIFDKN
jgi:hypothetical protein